MASRTLDTRSGGDPAAPPPSPEEIADKFPQFEVVECLGRGGMGVVYKARQKSLDRWVAIKVLAPERVHEERFAEHFEREAKTLAKMSHPNIVTVFDHGETDGLFYIVMEFIDGVNLRDLLREGKMNPEQALAIVPPVCEALEYAHDKGVVHRDIKPENVLLDRDGRVKIADFGIASLVGAAGERTGTPPYMAPEQQCGSVDRRADIYALGVVLYEMLTGERPDKDVVVPSRRVEVDVKIDEMVLRALEKEPERRYQTAGEFRTVVETMAATKAGDLKPGGETPNKVMPKTPRWLKLALGTAAFIAIPLTVWVTLNRHEIAADTRSALGRNFYATPFFDLKRFKELKPGMTEGQIRDALGYPLRYEFRVQPDQSWKTNEIWWLYTALPSREAPYYTSAELVTDTVTGKLLRTELQEYHLRPKDRHPPRFPLTIEAGTISVSRGDQTLTMRPSSEEIYVILTGMGVDSAEDLNDKDLRSREAFVSSTWQNVPRDKIRFVHMVRPKNDVTWPELNALLDELPDDSPIYSDYGMPSNLFENRGAPPGSLVHDVMVYCKGTLYHYPDIHGGDVVEPYYREDQNWLMHRLVSIAGGGSADTGPWGEEVEIEIDDAGAATTFGPVIEQTLKDPTEDPINAYIDFEAGALAPPPEDLSLSDHAAAWKWAMAEGIDAVANTRSQDVRGLLGYGLTAVRVPDDSWEQPPGLTEMNRLIAGEMWNQTRFGERPERSQSVLTVNTVSTDPDPSTTYLFRTSAGTLGLLQFVDYTDSPRGSVKIRYKLVQPESSVPGDEETPMAEPEDAQIIDAAPFAAPLSTGSVELVAVSRYPSDDELWWLPDGTPAGKNRFTTEASGGEDPQNFHWYSIVARLRDLPDNASKPKWKLEPRNSWAEGKATAKERDGQLVMISAKEPRSASTMNVSIGIAIGPWETIASVRAHAIPPLPQPGKYGEVVLLQPSAVDQGIRLTATHALLDMEMRLVAVENDGTEHIGVDVEQMKSESIGYTSATFPGLSLKQRDPTFQFRVRPYEWVTFKNVSLNPDHDE